MAPIELSCVLLLAYYFCIQVRSGSFYQAPPESLENLAEAADIDSEDVKTKKKHGNKPGREKSTDDDLKKEIEMVNVALKYAQTMLYLLINILKCEMRT